MRLAILLASAVLIAGAATALPEPKGEETLTIDLSSLPEGPTIFLKCSRSRDIANCGIMSLWEQTNGKPGLQSTIFSMGGQPRGPDASLLA